MTDKAQAIKKTNVKEIILKVLATIAIASVVLCITAWGTSERNNPFHKADWTSYELTFEEGNITLPCEYGKLQYISNYKMTQEFAASYISPEATYKGINLFSEDGNLALYIKVEPIAQKKTKADECEVTYINQSFDMVNYGENQTFSPNKSTENKHEVKQVYFPGKLTVGKEVTEEDLYKMFGIPAEIRRFEDDSIVVTWAENKNDLSHNYYKIVIENGIIAEIMLDCLK